MSQTDDIILTAEELDTIGEIMNISMGSAATAVSTMLEKQVTITTPSLTQDEFGNVDCSNLEPALIVRIKYVEGIEGTNVIMLRRRDIQIILDLLMGNEFSDETEDFEFDDMSMSAACEVMNQMMGSSATALSEILGIPVNISTPEAILVETKAEVQKAFSSIDDNERVVAISFKMMIKDIVDTTFSSFLPVALAGKIVQMVSGDAVEEPEPEMEAPVPQPVPVMQQPAPAAQQPPQPLQQPAPVAQQPIPAMQQPAPVAQQPVIAQQPAPVPQQTPPPPQQPTPTTQPEVQQFVAPQFTPTGTERVPMQFEAQPVPGAAPQQNQPNQQMPGMPQYPYGMPGQMPYMPQMPYGYMPPNPYMQQPQGFNVQAAEFPDFAKQMYSPVMPSGNSMGLLMGVQLDVSVVVGRAKRKIKDIMDFGQGTVVELDKQTGAPAEIMVNGQLLAYGDVIVVGDNFGVRITEIVGTKELLDSLESGNK